MTEREVPKPVVVAVAIGDYLPRVVEYCTNGCNERESRMVGAMTLFIDAWETYAMREGWLGRWP